MSNKPKNILFRADSSSTIGTGHIMRDLVLAEQFSDDNIIFATQDLPGNINHKIEEKEYTIEILHSNDIEKLDTLIKKLKIDMIVIDHYSIDYNFEKQLKESNPSLIIMVLDDTYERHYCDILLNHNIYADSTRYKNIVPENCELRCGAEYTLLREEFKAEKLKENKLFISKLNILIAMGGADHANLNVKILDVLENFSEIQVNVVTTTANQHLANLQEYVKNRNNVTVHVNSNQMAKLMYKSDLAIVTPSVTVNEIVVMDVPFIAIQTAENQRYMAQYLMDNNYHVLTRFDKKTLHENIKILLKKIDELLMLFKNIIDVDTDLQYAVLQWRNHIDIRKNMYTDDIITRDEHTAWLKSLQTNTKTHVYIAYKSSQPIGLVSINNDKSNT